ncbi:O-acetyl-ADP-ribose deacetylase [Abyssisolibacter fermentans]|uniref:O-acetyl-ADP-ribose deacetylase n=1 Tax=Abyssisolibacter fermentans TaxID=1766203 RepID=UPI0008296D22|nr:O-acetyl-ADP-ribose deacetylase [Abyssisolibacter fermentans]
MKYRGVNIKIVKGDITTLEVDAVVNAANTSLLGGSGVDGAIHKAGGESILNECKKIGGCPVGKAKITGAGNMPSKYVIHTVGPIYRDGMHDEPELLYEAYYNSLKLAFDYGIKSIAFPAISTGVYGYPKKDASLIAIKAVKDFIDNNSNSIMEIIFVLFTQEDYELYEKLIK